MLRLPDEGDVIPPIAVPQVQSAPRKSRKKSRGERIFDETFAKKEAESPLFIWLIVASIITGVVVVFFGLLMTGDEGNNGNDSKFVAPSDSDPEVVPNHELANNEMLIDKADDEVDEVLNVAMVEEVMVPVIEAFLTAESMDGALRWVRHPDRTEPRMESFYAEGYESKGFRGVTAGGYGEHIMRRGRWVRLGVKLDDFTTKLIWLAKNPTGEWRVDWESWVGWSDTSLNEIVESKLIGTFEVRVLVSLVDYYNFDFSDESAWTSYSLRNQVGDRPVYGYIKRGIEGDIQLGLHEEINYRRFILRVQRPANKRVSNQVEILEVIEEGWLKTNEEALNDE